MFTDILVAEAHLFRQSKASRHSLRMNVGVAHSEVNPNTRVMNSRGIWLAYLLLVTVLHVVLLSIPVLTVPLVWTLTNVIHNLVMYLFLHSVKGTPFETPDQGKARLLTHWEQIDYGIQFTSSRKFLTISPIVLYILASFYTKYDATHFLVNTGSLLSVLLPKLPLFHGVRIFGINSSSYFRDLRQGNVNALSMPSHMIKRYYVAALLHFTVFVFTF
ncbi:hypothetical protein DPEC_G00011680 [Dallia pectoralis]|uniref:Uncharacterized protein n=1 Tax=Dallia pectoralis TaxID=75939 RepID=A0ACC2HMJ2_DALPE|nr:hypothetical protein DPEC_G00011680 [Dallia pectoralis]